MEISIRTLKTRYQRESSRKNWNAYLLRYRSSVAYYEWWMEQPKGLARLEARLRQGLLSSGARFDTRHETAIASS